MINIDKEYRQKVINTLLDRRKKYDGFGKDFAEAHKIHPAALSRLVNGHRDFILSDRKIVEIGIMLGMLPPRTWKLAETDVFKAIKEEVEFCKNFSVSKIFVDECAIGKTTTAVYLSKHLENCFYIDASQAKDKRLFIKTLALAIGVDNTGRLSDVIVNIKQFLRSIPSPVVLIDDAGDLEYPAFLELKGLWNATEGKCAWYLLGADGLREKIERGITQRKVGYKEIFSRFSGRCTSVVPTNKEDKIHFYRKMISDVLAENVQDKNTIPFLVDKCMIDDDISGLRRMEAIEMLYH